MKTLVYGSFISTFKSKMQVETCYQTKIRDSWNLMKLIQKWKRLSSYVIILI